MQQSIKWLFTFLVCWIAGMGWAQEPDSMKITKLTESVFIHETFKTYKGVLFPTNGLLIETGNALIMVDAGWVPEQTNQIIQWAKDSIGKPITDCIVTHYHDDRTAGIEALQLNGTRVWASALTIEKCREFNEALPESTLPAEKVLRFGELELWWIFPGAGHTDDNIVIWIPAQKVLFGGCLIKSCDSQGMGNTADADLEHWDDAIKTLMTSFPDARYIVPGHQGWDCETPLENTLELLRQHTN